MAEDPTSRTWAPTGSCGAYQGRATWLTAAHCVPEGHRLVLLRNGLTKHQLLVTHVERHPTIDLAMIHVDLTDDTAPGGLDDTYFDDPPQVMLEGGDFTGHGFPVDAASPVPRLTKGYFQRYMTFEPPTGGSYWAGEMSVPAPGGSSGSVLAYENQPWNAVAVITGNWETTTTVHAYEEVDDGGKVYKETIKRVLAYGTALMLFGHREWLADAATLSTH